MSEEIRLSVENNVAHLVIDRPDKLNSITVAMGRQLFDHIDEINRNAEIRAVVIAGEGQRAFSAGSDVTTLDAYGSNWQMRNRRDYRNDYIFALRDCRKPMIARIDGFALGGGLEIACIADIRVVTPQSKFAAAEIKLGWHAGSGQTQYLPRLVGYGNALRMLLTGDMVDADEALRMGLVQYVVGRAEIVEFTAALAAKIASHSAMAVQSTRHIVLHGMDLPLTTALAWENDLFSYLMTTEDAHEGRRAFAEKRPPRFDGR